MYNYPVCFHTETGKWKKRFRVPWPFQPKKRPIHLIALHLYVHTQKITASLYHYWFHESTHKQPTTPECQNVYQKKEGACTKKAGRSVTALKFLAHPPPLAEREGNSSRTLQRWPKAHFRRTACRGSHTNIPGIQCTVEETKYDTKHAVALLAHAEATYIELSAICHSPPSAVHSRLATIVPIHRIACIASVARIACLPRSVRNTLV
ncbi:unnamed protein product [Pylaiella littoralis]